MDQRAHYWLPPHIRACATRASTVLLDLQRNRYFGIGRDETRALLTLAQNWSAANAHATRALEPMPLGAAVPIANALVDAGLLSRSAPSEDVIGTATIDLSTALASVGHEVDGPAHVQYGHVISL